MILQPHIRRNPAETAISRLLTGYLDEAAATSGLGHAFVQGALCAMHDILLDGVHDLIEPVATVTPGTGDLIISFRISNSLDRALTRAAQNFSTCHFKKSLN